MDKKTIYDVLSAYKASRDSTPAEEPIRLNQGSVGSFNIRSLIKSAEPHKEIYTALKNDPDVLAKGYRVAVSLYQDTLNAKKTNQGFFEKKYKIADKVDVYVVKSVGETVELGPEVITPNRFSMILALAANSAMNSAIAHERKAVIARLSQITNPFGMLHGFYPGVLEEDQITINGWRVKLLHYYLITTIGFDAIAHSKPLYACAIAAFRCRGDNPRKLGLMRDLDEDATVEESTELASRCIQGVYTKEFTYRDQKFKVQDALEDEKFYNAVVEEVKFLIKYASEPTRARNIRILNVAYTLANIEIGNETGDDKDTDEEFEHAQDDDDEYEAQRQARIAERKLQEQKALEPVDDPNRMSIEKFQELAAQNLAEKPLEPSGGAINKKPGEKKQQGTPDTLRRQSGPQAKGRGRGLGEDRKDASKPGGKGTSVLAADAALMKEGSDSDN